VFRASVLGFGLAVLSTVGAAAGGRYSSAGGVVCRSELLSQLLRDYPDVSVVAPNGVVQRLYGGACARGDTPADTAAGFQQTYSMLFGVPAAELRAGCWDNSEGVAAAQRVMYVPESGRYKFLLFRYLQQRGGIPVFRSELRLLVRNAPGYPLVWVNSTLRPLGEFTPQQAPLLCDAAIQIKTGMARFTAPKLVIYGGAADVVSVPALAYAFVGERGALETGDYEKWLYVTEAETGRVLYQDNQIIHEDVRGAVSGLATPPPKADICADEIAMPLVDALVCIQGSTCVYTDGGGNFVIPNGGTSPVTVTSPVRGHYFSVHDYTQPSHDPESLSQTVVPPGPVTFVHNAANTEFTRAQVNGYVQATIVRNFALAVNPAYPVIGTQTEFPVNVNINSSCNAFYDGTSINFYRANGGCPNTAFASVVHHEYGHHLIAVAGNQAESQYHEGMADTVALLIADDPVTGYGFFGDCEEGVRTAVNALQYPCIGEDHACGQLLSGCVWETRNELAATHPGAYRQILANLTINSILLHPSPDIDPQIAADFLTLDDDDGNIGNGTPHFGEICRGFGVHGMHCPNDCNGNGVLDAEDIANGTSADCDENGIPDECELQEHDCNHNGVLDACDIANGTSQDCNGDGLPDECVPTPAYGWTAAFGSYGVDYAYGIVVDHQGDILAIGAFDEEVDFDPGPGEDIHTALGNDFFVTKLHVDGTYAWTRTVGIPSPDLCGVSDIAVDSQDNVYLVGRFSGTVDFDPGPDVDWHTAPALDDIYVMRLSADGSYGWTRTFGSPLLDLAGRISVDENDDVWVAGEFRGTADFDPGPGVDERTSNGDYDVFLSHYRADGTYVSTLVWGAAWHDEPVGLACDGHGHVIIAGQFKGTIDFDPTGGTDLHASIGNFDAFIVKLGIAGAYIWTRTWGGHYADEMTGMAVDPGGNVVTFGTFSGNVDFDPGEGEDLHSGETVDRFVSKVLSNGDFAWAQTWGDPNVPDYPYNACKVAVDRNGDAFLVGPLYFTIDFDPGPGVDEHTSNGSADFFLAHYKANGEYGWTLSWGSVDGDSIRDITVAPGGDILLTGSFQGTVDFDPGPGVDYHRAHCFYACPEDAFITRFVYDAVLYGDCNGNGIYDVCDIAAGTSSDLNGNRIPDECEALGDLNCDGVVNFDDINPFVLGLSDPLEYETAYPNCDVLHGDCNGDGGVNFDDIDPFVALLSGG
jgi:hypothetical protein